MSHVEADAQEKEAHQREAQGDAQIIVESLAVRSAQCEEREGARRDEDRYNQPGERAGSEHDARKPDEEQLSQGLHKLPRVAVQLVWSMQEAHRLLQAARGSRALRTHEQQQEAKRKGNNVQRYEEHGECHD
eukprot:7379925-Prymnesium_polylepis.3